jgi:hypothetical protein
MFESMTSITSAIEPRRPSRRGSGKIEQTEQAFASMLADASTPGFYGTIGLTLVVQDGRIQYIRTLRDETIR